MRGELAIAGVCCFGLAVGHTALVGRATPAMIRFTWDVVSIFLLAFAVLFVALASWPDAETRTLLLRWSAVLWLVATARAVWDARHRPSRLVRFPVVPVFVVIAALCWAAAS